VAKHENSTPSAHFSTRCSREDFLEPNFEMLEMALPTSLD
jgi:hypothetical protein